MPSWSKKIIIEMYPEGNVNLWSVESETKRRYESCGLHDMREILKEIERMLKHERRP